MLLLIIPRARLMWYTWYCGINQSKRFPFWVVGGFFETYPKSCIMHAYMHTSLSHHVSEKQLTLILGCLLQSNGLQNVTIYQLEDS